MNILRAFSHVTVRHRLPRPRQQPFLIWRQIVNTCLSPSNVYKMHPASCLDARYGALEHCEVLQAAAKQSNYVIYSTILSGFDPDRL